MARMPVLESVPRRSDSFLSVYILFFPIHSSEFFSSQTRFADIVEIEKMGDTSVIVLPFQPESRWAEFKLAESVSSCGSKATSRAYKCRMDRLTDSKQAMIKPNIPAETDTSEEARRMRANAMVDRLTFGDMQFSFSQYLFFVWLTFSSILFCFLTFFPLMSFPFLSSGSASIVWCGR
jgi:hypothetical protein